MEAKIIEFYQSKKLPIEQILETGKNRRGLNKASIYESLEKVYDEYQSGKIQKDIMIVWRVWELAKQVSGKKFDKLLKTKEQLNKEISELQHINKIQKVKLIIVSSGLFCSLSFITYWLFLR